MKNFRIYKDSDFLFFFHRNSNRCVPLISIFESLKVRRRSYPPAYKWRLTSPLHEPLKLFFKIKAAKVARNPSLLSHLTFARRAETSYSIYWLCSLGNGPLVRNESVLFLKPKGVSRFFKTVNEFIWVRAEANEIFFFKYIYIYIDIFARSLSRFRSILG